MTDKSSLNPLFHGNSRGVFDLRHFRRTPWQAVKVPVGETLDIITARTDSSNIGIETLTLQN